ncbi:MAG TPA: ferric reductase-like transmembrane domain-containing protein [Methylomirabilota bacterium]|nr:ferric reductase-like transmembrane domain-containing protein [Methylomirabilota bacterium]
MTNYFSSLLRNLRFYFLAFSFLFSGSIYLWATITIPSGTLQIIKMQQIYGLTSLVALYFSLLAGPFCYTFKTFPFTKQFLHARRAIGVSAFYFAFLHTFLTFFYQLGGFAGLGFLDWHYLVAVLLGFVALIILFFLTITSLDWAIEKMRFKNWKLLHRFIYLGGILILAHTLILGTHFSNLSGIISKITFFALAFLLLLETPRFDNIFKKFIRLPSFGLSFTVTAVILGTIFFSFISPIVPSTNGPVSFDIHAAHRQLAQQAQQNPLGNNFNNLPGLNGDRTKRYTVSMSTDPKTTQPNQDITIHFQIYDASSGIRVPFFRTLYAKQMHLIIVNNNLTYFSHIHPTQDGQDFVITTQFPTNDMYHMYISFQPFGGIEQQVGFSLPVGNIPKHLAISQTKPDTDNPKDFGNYTVSVDTHGPLNAAAMSLGQQTISLTVTDKQTGKPVTDLKPYLDAFGHLTMINQDTFDFIHVHPYSLTPPPANAKGGPTVDFLPIGIYGPFKKGTYRMFAEFNPNGQLLTADFTITLH